VFSFLAAGGIGALQATPMLRLVSATVGPIAITPGANGVNQTVEAYNAGGGTLSLSVSSSASWLTPSVGPVAACATTRAAAACTPLIFALNTSSLAASATPYTGTVTVTSPGAVDAPQTITVTVVIGGAVPSSVDLYVPPYNSSTQPSASVSFSTSSYMTSKVTVNDGATPSWLTLTLSGGGCNPFDPNGCLGSAYTYAITVTPQITHLAGNSYTGSIVTSGSNFAPDNKTIPVTMHVTSDPIASASATQINEQLAAGAAVGYAVVTMSNSGNGTLAISGATVAGQGATASVSGSYVVVAFDPTGLAAGTYTSSLNIVSNAANSPTVIPVTFNVVAAGAPWAYYGGVVDDAVFGQSGMSVAPGDIVALFGEQLSFVAPVYQATPPLATTLGGTSVTVNGEAAPLYYSSYGQINFQIPTDIAPGTAPLVQVTTAPNPLLPLTVVGNTVSVNVVNRAPRLLLLSDGYGAIEDASQGYSLPLLATMLFPGFTSKPAFRGDVLTIYAIGLGATNPAVASGQPAPDGGVSGPLAQLISTPTVAFSGVTSGPLGEPVTANPSWAGLSPYRAGLYQVNVAIPSSSPLGTVKVSLTFPDGTTSNSVLIAVQ
jgi:uncharacterized protein (TIGR03437 family)